MIFALMRQGDTEDYINLFEGLKRAFCEEGLPCSPHSFTLDFEAAVWKALKICFPNATLNGNAFHWARCLQGKWENLGLQTLPSANGLLRKIYTWSQTLQYLPERLILGSFENIKKVAQVFPENHQVHSYLKYLLDTWIQSAVHPPSTWCQERSVPKSKDEMEVWHRRFNVRMKSQPDFYQFVEKIYAELVQTREMLQSGDLRENTGRTNDTKAALENLWQLHQRGLPLIDLMDNIARLFGYKSADRQARERREE